MKWILKQPFILPHCSQVFFKIFGGFKPDKHNYINDQDDTAAHNCIQKCVNIYMPVRIKEIREEITSCKGRKGAKQDFKGVDGERLHIQFFPDEPAFGYIKYHKDGSCTPGGTVNAVNWYQKPYQNK